MNRFGFVLRRPAQLIPVLLGISAVTFVLLQKLPGDPARAALGVRASEEAVRLMRERYHLDQPLPAQYLHYMADLLRGDLGESIAFRRPVAELIADRLPPTLFLLVYGLFLSIALTLSLSIAAARRRGALADRAIRLLCVAGVGLPPYFIGLLLIAGLSLRLKLFPVSGYGPSLVENLWHLFLPALTLTITIAPALTRTLRATLLAQADADHAIAARAKGLPEDAVFYRHVLRGALPPALNLLGVVVAGLLGGAVLIESVFNIPGLGSLLVRSVLARDHFVVQGVTLLLAVLVVLTNLVFDMITALVDPRVKQ